MTDRDRDPDGVGLGGIDAAEGISDEPVTQWDLFFTRLRRHRLAMLSAAFLLFMVLLSFVVAPLVTCEKNVDPCDKVFYHPETQRRDATGRLLVNIGPRDGIVLGTDEVAHDVLSRVVHGGRASLLVGLVTGFIVALFGTVVGSIAGFYPGPVDQALMRFTDLVLGLPLLPVAIVVGRVIQDLPFLPPWMRGGPWGIAFLFGFLLWGTLARIVRAEFLSLREKEFVEAARASGASDRRIVFRHILPNAMSPIIVQTTLIVGTAVILEAALSFLGFGVPPPTPTWGGMAQSGAGIAARGFWWELVGAGLALVLTVLSVNFIGDGLRDALDPTQTIERK
ncbi:MAG TPA: ABC transporter permease [Acidimicrobiia bacterium]|jgi:peptide/nickel transport system permease protein